MNNRKTTSNKSSSVDVSKYEDRIAELEKANSELFDDIKTLKLVVSQLNKRVSVLDNSIKIIKSGLDHITNVVSRLLRSSK